MFFRMIRGALFRQRGKMLLIAFTIMLGASLATAMLNTMMGVGDKVNAELKTYGANIVVKPKDSSLLSDIYDVEDSSDQSLNTSYLKEDELGNIKQIFWAFNIIDYTPFLSTTVELGDGTTATVTGTWFDHHLDLPTGETVDTGIENLRSWWDVTDGEWLDEQTEGADTSVMVGATLASELGIKAGDTLTLKGTAQTMDVTVIGIYDAGGDGDDVIYSTLDTAQALCDKDGDVESIEVSALTTPDNELSERAAKNPKLLSASDYETWYCTAYVSSICYQIQEAMTNATASAVRQVADSEGNILEKTQLLMVLITILALIASALGITNLVTASVMERSQEIGLLKAIGAHDGPITAMILLEVLVTALAGTVVGYVVGIGFTQIIGLTVFGSSIAINANTIPIVALLIGAVVLAGCLPAIRMVLRLDPAEVLHGSKA